MTSPKISIITVVYNSVDTIEVTIRSVINQSYGNIEYIVVDGGSTDGTLDIVRKYEKYIALCISEKDNGVYDAMNKGIQKATGEWINFMNSGDYFYNNDVIQNIFSNDTYSTIDVIYGNSLQKKGDKLHLFEGGLDINLLSKHPIYRHGASFTKSTVHAKYLFDLSKSLEYGFALDFYQIHRLYKAGAQFKRLPITIMVFEFEGISNNLYKGMIYNYRITGRGRGIKFLTRLIYLYIRHQLNKFL